MCSNLPRNEKIAKEINNKGDSIQLQNSIDNFMMWCEENGLSVNKSFTHRRNPKLFDYYLNGKKIERVNVHLDSKLNFMSHREIIKKKALWRLSFVRRLCRANGNVKVSKLLYTSLSRSIFEVRKCSVDPPLIRIQLKVSKNKQLCS